MFQRLSRILVVTFLLASAAFAALAPSAAASSSGCSGFAGQDCIHVRGTGLHVDGVSFTTHLPARAEEHAVFYYTFKGKVIHSTGKYYFHNTSYWHSQSFTSRVWAVNRTFTAGKLCAYSKDVPGHHYDSAVTCVNIHK